MAIASKLTDGNATPVQLLLTQQEADWLANKLQIDYGSYPVNTKPTHGICDPRCTPTNYITGDIMNKKLLERIKALFLLRLAKKTSWGRKEVIEHYNAAVTEALMEQLP